MSTLRSGLSGASVGPMYNVVFVDGRPWTLPDIRVSEIQYQEFRQGYRCVVCLAAQESAFPEKCCEFYCEFPIRDKQLWVLDENTRQEEGVQMDELGSDEERRERLREKGVFVP